jgi:hypothetical protein
VVSDSAEKPKDSEHNQHGPQRPVNTEAHAPKKQEDDDDKE